MSRDGLVAWGLLAGVVPALKVWPLERVRRALRRLPAAPADDPARIGRRVERAARLVPGAACLAVAVVAEADLTRRGIACQLTVGVRKDVGGTFRAHAWLETSGALVTGGSERTGFTPLWTSSQDEATH